LRRIGRLEKIQKIGRGLQYADCLTIHHWLVKPNILFPQCRKPGTSRMTWPLLKACWQAIFSRTRGIIGKRNQEQFLI
jgi:hypothetical protein